MLTNIIEMKLPVRKPEIHYLTGRTLLLIARVRGQVLFDVTGTPVVESEFYECTHEGIKRVES